MKKVLIITYYWPPSGGAGVQRWLKFSKYLPEYGWEPIILTVEPESAAYPLTDHSLEKDVPSSLRVVRTRAKDYFAIYKRDRSKIPSAGFATSVDNTLIGKLMRFVRGNFFIPDPRKGWNNYAFRKACEIIEQESVMHLITTSPPHSTQLVGIRLSKRFPGIKWIADLRDPWTDIYYYEQFYPTYISRNIDAAFEKSVIRNAGCIITVGESLKSLFNARYPGSGDKITVITNGYDPDDFIGLPETRSPRFTITYVGTLSELYPVDGFVAALKEFRGLKPDFLFRFAGSIAATQKEIFMNQLSPDNLEFLPYSPHNEAVKYLKDSSVLVLIIPSHSSAKSIVTGKLFEYLGAGKPVLCLGPEDGDASKIIRESRAGICVDYSGKDKMLAFITAVSDGSFSPSAADTEAYTRKNLAARLAAVLN